MSSVIDPVTGLPMAPAPDVLSDIPLGTQVFPYTDLKATDQPPRGPSYPNDILNTAALLTAGDSTQPDNPAQTVWTDGNHRLLTSAPSGGGSTLFVPQSQGGDWDYHFLGAGSGQTDFGSIGTPQYMLSIAFSWFIDPGNSTWPVTGLLSVGLQLDDNEQGSLIVIGVYASSATDGSTKAGREVYYFTPAWELAGSGLLDPGNGYHLCGRNETTGDINYNITTIVSTS